MNVSGKPIYYRRCDACGFLFTEAFDDWSPEALLKYIYNDDYVLVDPDYVVVRPTNNAGVVAKAFEGARAELSILDYGGGSGLFARLLVERGFRAATYDPFSAFSARPQAISSFELDYLFPRLSEQCRVPHNKIVADMNGMLAAEGVILFSTLTQPANFAELGLRWWYVAPRNGHVSLYSQRGLTILFEKHGMQIVSFSEVFHMAFRKVPAFAAHLVPSIEAAPSQGLAVPAG